MRWKYGVRYPENLSLSDRIGVSNLCMMSHGESLVEALDLSHEAGFLSLDLVPGVCDGSLGYPDREFPVGIELDELQPQELESIRRAVSRFSLINVHTPVEGVNIACRNRGIARESRRQYLELVRFAGDIGSKIVTFHPGIPDCGDQRNEREFAVEQSIEFGRELAEAAESRGILAGYENLGGFPKLKEMEAIIEGIGSESFGLILDVGHVWLVSDRDVGLWLDRLGDCLVAVHMHGTFFRPDRGFINHQDLAQNTCTDLPELMKALDDLGYGGPINMELHAADIRTYLDMCLRGRKIILEAAGEKTE